MILVVVPAFNEASSIGPVVRGLFESASALAELQADKHGSKDTFQVVVVDDGSHDATAKLAREAGATVISHLINRGQGAALETGNAYARAVGADVVVHFDADRQFNPADIAPAVAAMRANNVDVVLGSRFLDARSKIPFFKRTILLPIARLINRLMTGLKLSDGQNGFRVLSKKALNTLSITQDGMAHNTEIMQQIAVHDLSYREVPVEVTYHEYGQNFAGGVKIMRDLAKAALLK